MKNSIAPRSFVVRARKVLSTIIQPAVLGLLLAHAQAGNTWDGGGGDNNWGTGANWNPDGSPAPGSGNDIFFAGSTRLSPFNNYTAFDDWRNITFNAGASSFNITGNAIDLFGKIENLSSNAQTFGLGSIALNSATANEFNPVNGNLTITSANIFTNGNQLKVFGNNGFTLSFAAGTNIQQSGSLSINQNSTVVFNSAHSYTGDTFVNAGKLQFAAGGSANSSIIRIGDTTGTVAAEMDLTVATGGQSFANTIVSRPGSAGYGTRMIDSQNTSGTNTLSGVIALDAALTLKQAAGGTLSLSGSFLDVKQQILTVNTAGTVDISKPLNSSFTAGGSLIKQGNGTLVLSNVSNSYTGTNSATLNANGTQIAAGTLAIAADTSLGIAPAGAYDNVQFTGTGTLRSDASIALNANRNISIASGATASLDSNGNTFTINGAISGASGTLNKSGGGTTILNGGNSYGVTTITTGTLQIGNGSTTGTLGSGAVTNNAALSFNRSNSMTVGNDISGTGSVTQSGGGTTILTGSNSYTTTTISAGTLQIGNGGATGSLGSGAVTNNAALVFNRSVAVNLTNAIGGTGTLTQNGSNIITIGSANTYSGATTINSGALRVTSNDALGTGAAGTTVNSGGQLRVAGVAYSTAEALSINGTGLSGLGALYSVGAVDSSYAGQVTVASNATIGSIGNSLTLTGGIVTNGTTVTLFGNSTGAVNVNTVGISGSGAGSNVIVDASSVTLNAASTYNGTTTIRNAGTLNANVAAALPTSTRSAFVLDDTGSGSSTLGINGSTTQVAASLTGAASSFVGITGGSTLTVGTSSGSTTFAGNINGSGTLVKDGASTQVLSGANAGFTGNVTVQGGTLKLDISGSVSGSAVVTVGGVGSSGAVLDVTTKTGGLTIGGAQTLKGIGQINGNTTIAGTHSPGNSPGLQTFNGNLIYSTGSMLNWELATNSVGTRGTDFDGIDVIGAGVLTINTGVISNLIFNGAGSAVDFTNSFWNSSHSWLVYDDVNAASLASGTVFDTINVSQDSLSNTLGTGTFSWQQLANDVYLNFTVTPVPEPTGLITGLLCLTAASARRRRRSAV